MWFKVFFTWCTGSGVAQWLRRCATSRTVPGSIPSGVTEDSFRGSFRQKHVPWGRLSLWKWVPGISPGVKAAGAYGWRPTTLVVPNIEMIRGLNLPGTPRATSACRRTPLLFSLDVQFSALDIYFGLLTNPLLPKKTLKRVVILVLVTVIIIIVIVTTVKVIILHLLLRLYYYSLSYLYIIPYIYIYI